MNISYNAGAAAAEIAEVLAKHRIPIREIQGVLDDAQAIAESVPCMSADQRKAAWDVRNKTEFYDASGKLEYIYRSTGHNAEQAKELDGMIEKELLKRFPQMPPKGSTQIKEVYAVVANDNFPLSERHVLLGLYEDEKEAAAFLSAVEKERPHSRPTIEKRLLNDASVPPKKK